MKPKVTITKLIKYDKLMDTKYQLTDIDTLSEVKCLNGRVFFKNSLLTSNEVDDVIKASAANKFAIRIVAEQYT